MKSKSKVEETMEKLEDLLPRNSEINLNLGMLTVECPICGKEFGCNKAYHFYHWQ